MKKLMSLIFILNFSISMPQVAYREVTISFYARTLEWLDSSKVSNFLSQYCLKPFYKHRESKLSLGPASSEYQELATDAFKAIKITHNVQIHKTNTQLLCEFGHPDTIGLSSWNGIYINEEELGGKHIPYGYKRHVVFHEVAHQKYHFGRLGSIISILPLSGLMSLTSYFLALPSRAVKFISKENLWYTTKSAAQTYFIFQGFEPLLSKHIEILKYWHERRADIESLNALNCYKCIYELADFKQYSSTSKMGYLSADEIRTIGRKIHKLCPHHQW